MINVFAEQATTSWRSVPIYVFVFDFQLFGHEAVYDLLEIMEEKVSPFLPLIFGAKSIHLGLFPMHFESPVLAV